MSGSAAGWLRPAAADPAAAYRLLLLHPSGAGAAMFASWIAQLPSDVAGQAVQLPGRQDRHGEQPYTSVGPLLDILVRVLVDEDDGRPYALFGHSMGGLLAYRAAVALAAAAPSPALIAVAGWTPAGLPTPSATVPAGFGPDGSTEELLAGVSRLHDMPPGGLADTEAQRLILPALRADLAVCHSYVDDGARVDCPLVAYNGRDDPLSPPQATSRWADRTPRYLGDRRFPGGHFFVHDHAAAILADLVQLLRRHTRAPSPVNQVEEH